MNNNNNNNSEKKLIELNNNNNNKIISFEIKQSKKIIPNIPSVLNDIKKIQILIQKIIIF